MKSFLLFHVRDSFTLAVETPFSGVTQLLQFVLCVKWDLKHRS
jgi:hypothetical protein